MLRKASANCFYHTEQYMDRTFLPVLLIRPESCCLAGYATRNQGSNQGSKPRRYRLSDTCQPRRWKIQRKKEKSNCMEHWCPLNPKNYLGRRKYYRPLSPCKAYLADLHLQDALQTSISQQMINDRLKGFLCKSRMPQISSF